MHPSVLDFEARVRRVPAVLRQALTVAPPEGLRQLGSTSVVLTGIGASEAVTRSLEPWFRHELRIRVTQVPLSAFIADDVRMQGQTLVLLSQDTQFRMKKYVLAPGGGFIFRIQPGWAKSNGFASIVTPCLVLIFVKIKSCCCAVIEIADLLLWL